MAKVIMVCGRICCGKSTYAHKLRIQHKAVILSIDEIMLALLPPYLGDRHEKYVKKTQKYLFSKAAEIADTGIDVILDWGFWSDAERQNAKQFFSQNGIECELHYLSLSDDEWHARITKRNTAVSAGDCDAYFVDENLARKCLDRFQPPQPQETDVIVQR